MIIDDTYREILNLVIEYTGVEEQDITHSNIEEHVDARYLLVQILCDRGFSDTQIALLMGVTRACVCTLRNKFRYRTKKYFVNVIYKELRAKLFAEEQ